MHLPLILAVAILSGQTPQIPPAVATKLEQAQARQVQAQQRLQRAQTMLTEANQALSEVQGEAQAACGSSYQVQITPSGPTCKPKETK